MSSVVQAKPKALELEYQTGFGNHHATEALPGALPEGRNSPQKAPYGLYAELLSGTAFTAPRDQNSRTWLYRIRPSADQDPYSRSSNGLWRSSPFDETAPTPDRLRWSPLPIPDETTDFIDGMITMAGNGDLASHTGLGIHLYCANASMRGRFFYNADGELLVVPQQGRLIVYTEMGILGVAPGEICVIPRGIRFRVELPDGPSRGYVCENYGAALRLPELGPLGSNGLANPRDFETPVAAFEDRDGDFELLCKFAGNLWTSRINRSPLDVVAWHGNCAPYKYDLSRFNTIGTISFDHPDPSIFTVLTSPSGSPLPGTANVDFVIFPERWLVAEDTFRPPWFHRNFMSEFMGLIHGAYDAKAEGFLPGGASLHNCMSPHGPDTETFKKASAKELSPERVSDTLAFMFETKVLCRPSEYAMSSSCLQYDYADCWKDMPKNFSGKP